MKNILSFFYCPVLFLLSGICFATDFSAASGEGLSFDSKIFSARAYASLPYKEDFRWGTKLFLFEKILPVTVKAGSLNFSGSLSKLTSPSPQVLSNPLSKSFTFSPGTGSSLPGISSGTKDPSLSVKIEKTFDKLKFSLDSGTDFTDRWFSTGIFKFTPSRFISFQNALTFGRFYLKNDSAFLKKNSISFDEGWFYAGAFESFFTCPYFKASVYSTFHQNPYGVIAVSIFSRLRFTAGPFLADFSYFAVPTTGCSPRAAPLITASSSLLKNIEQAAVNPQLIFFLKDGSVLHTGICATETWKIAGVSQVSEINTLKAAFSAAIEKQDSYTSILIAVSNLLIWGTPPDKSSTPDTCWQLSWNWRKNSDLFRTAFSADFKQYPPLNQSSSVKQELSVSVSEGIGKKRFLTTGISIDGVLKNGLLSGWKTVAETSLKLKIKKLSVSAKVSFQLKGQTS